MEVDFPSMECRNHPGSMCCLDCDCNNCLHFFTDHLQQKNERKGNTNAGNPEKKLQSAKREDTKIQRHKDREPGQG